MLARILLCIYFPAIVHAYSWTIKQGLNAKKCEAKQMNKWIPISLLVFLGVYLLTTTQVPVTKSPGTQVAGAISEEFNNIVTFTPH